MIDLEMYEDVLNHRRHAFPPYFFVGEEGKRYAGIITRYVLEEKKRWNHDEICLNICRKVFEEYRLAGMLKTYFNNSVFHALNNVYPGEFYPWELVKARRKALSGEAGREVARHAIRWMILDKLHYIPTEFHKITVRTFVDYRLDGLLQAMYHGSPWEAILDTGL
jgi:hypothetical protein